VRIECACLSTDHSGAAVSRIQRQSCEQPSGLVLPNGHRSGNTNVTDRVRYFTIHPFIVHLWAKGKATTDKAALKDLVRRVECILAISERIRVRDTDEFAPGIIGRLRVDRWLREQSHPLPDNLRVPLRELEREYFKNSWGGFGQYYSGPEQELQIIGWQEGLPRLIKPLGPQLASAVGSAFERSHFDQLLSDDKPKVAQFRQVGETLAFNTLEPPERNFLRQILLDTSNHYGEAGLRRRRSMLLLLAASHQSSQGLNRPDWDLMDAALHGRIPVKKSFHCPAEFEPYLGLWRTYTLTEFLAFALEMILAVSVELVAEAEVTRRPLSSVNALAHEASSLVSAQFARKLVKDLVTECAKKIHSPHVDTLTDKCEEGVLRRSAETAMAEGRRANALRDSLRLLARLAGQIEADLEICARFQKLGLRLGADRIGLADLARYVKNSHSSTVKQFVTDIVKIVVNSHLRIATAKLVHNEDFTFKLVFEGGILRKVREVEPTFSHPPLQQGAQILAGLGFFTYQDGGFHITHDGVTTLREFRCING